MRSSCVISFCVPFCVTLCIPHAFPLLSAMLSAQPCASPMGSRWVPCHFPHVFPGGAVMLFLVRYTLRSLCVSLCSSYVLLSCIFRGFLSFFRGFSAWVPGGFLVTFTLQSQGVLMPPLTTFTRPLRLLSLCLLSCVPVRSVLRSTVHPCASLVVPGGFLRTFPVHWLCLRLLLMRKVVLTCRQMIRFAYKRQKTKKKKLYVKNSDFIFIWTNRI